jgi:GT2 family glycosyltransferase
MILNEYVCSNNVELLYTGNPNFEILEKLSEGPGDIWHSSFEQGYKNAFPELAYQTAVFFWYINDFDNIEESLSWRVNPNAFVVRKNVWNTLDGFDKDYQTLTMQGLDFGYNAVRNSGAVCLYVKNLFTNDSCELSNISIEDRYAFYVKNFKKQHAFYMLYRKGFYKLEEWKGLQFARKNYSIKKDRPIVLPKKLNPMKGKPTVSYIIPTMLRQDFTLQLLDDLNHQTFLVKQVVIVDATPENQRDLELYNFDKYPFEIILKWQESKGSCRARNEAIDLCSGEYIVFGDDDIRLPPEFIENHIRFLQTNNAGASNGLDIRADNQEQNLEDLARKLEILGDKRWKAGCTQMFSNANSCVRKEHIDELIGNDINFDGGYGEDSDFGMSLSKIGVTVLHNPFSTNLHLKPAVGGYRFWGAQSSKKGKERKAQPWELNFPVTNIVPVPSPTVMYGILKHFNDFQVEEYKQKHFFLYVFKGSKRGFLSRVFNLRKKNKQFKKSLFYANNLMKLGKRTN